MKILFYGDIVGKIGRQAMIKVVPDMKKEHQPDLIVTNVENIAHGIGTTKKTLDDVVQAGVDFFTSGNHALRKPEAAELLDSPDINIIRPANLLDNVAGQGYKIIAVGSRQVMFINLLGQVFMKDEYSNPFLKLDEILDKVDTKNVSAIIVDFHAEATSEKVAFGWYADGRVSAVLGTHTHVPTADNKILTKGTGFVSDVGMVGARDSVIGDLKEPIIASFLSGESHKLDIPESGLVDVGAILLEIDPKTKKTTKITRVDRTVEV